MPDAEVDGGKEQDEGVLEHPFAPDAQRVRWESVSHGDQAVLVVSGQGTLCEVLQAPEDAARGESLVVGADLDALWPGDQPQRLRNKVRRAVRSRRVQSAEYASSAQDAFHDFVFIPQGRDRVIVVVRDVSARRSDYQRMRELAYVDTVTKLPNQRLLMEELGRCLEALRLQEGRAAVLCFHFDAPEPLSGVPHSTQTDALLVELASRFMHELRGVNEVGTVDYDRYTVAARISPQQFAVLLPAIDSGSDAEGVARRLVETLEQPIQGAAGTVKLAVSAGIALYPQDGKESQVLFSNAVAAMEDARANREPCKFHSGTVRMRALQRQDLELELKAALERDEFSIEYLPIVDATSRLPRSVEALLRWPQGVFGSQSIEQVIAVAENTGLILPIGDWVLRQSCMQLRHWCDGGVGPIRLSINFSVQELARDDVVERVARALDAAGVAPEQVDIEITEYALFRDAMRSYRTLAGLKDLGVGVVLDDYGTGACSLAHVARSPIDAVKIDNSFVAGLRDGAAEASVCAAIAALAEQLNLRVVAEGVETAEQADLLSSLGCSELQGFYVSRPLAAASVASFVGSATAADASD
ncbi:MAG: bifunctional diguanylate cyclase/phosphodiesterase [Pseudomonadota bacterium]